MKLKEYFEFKDFSISEESIINNIDILSIKFYKNTGLLQLILETQGVLPYSLYSRVYKLILSRVETNLDIIINNKIKNYALSDILQYNSLLEGRLASFSSALLSFDDTSNTLSILNGEFSEIELEEYSKSLSKYGFEGLKIVNKKEYKVNNEETKIKVVIPEANKPTPVKKVYKSSKKDYLKISLQHIEYPEENIQFDAKVLKLDKKTSRNTNKTILTMLTSDGESAIYSKIIESKYLDINLIDSIKVNQRYTIYGSIVLDLFQHELNCMVRDIKPLEDIKVIDPAEKKRVELHTHTTMSEMDGVSDVTDIIKYVHGLGHDGIAITDHGSVQAFVKAHNMAKALSKNQENKFKVIYGCEFYMVEKNLNIVRNYNEGLLKDQTYIIFDLETTGLSSHFDKIIEFGAVKVKNNEQVASMQVFINPEKDIPIFITSKTNITNEMVSRAKTFKDVAKDLIDFIGDGVLVAHNATFDYGFINEELKKAGYKPLSNPVIDTYDLAKVIHPERKSYRLGSIARMYKITYDEDVAHRADYDAEILRDVFLRMLTDVYKKDIFTLKDLQEKQPENTFSKQRSSHIIALAKNQEGIKDIYELVTISNTQTMSITGKGADEVNSEPRIIRDTLTSRRENLLLGSACQNGDVFNAAANRDDDTLLKVIDFYDYIEVMPLDNYRNLIDNHSIPSIDRLKDILKRIIKTALQLNKIVVATGDVHYLTKEDKKFRDVYINSQGVGGVRHPLYTYRSEARKNQVNPDQHFRLTNEMMEAFQFLDDEKLIEMLVYENSRKIFDSIDFTQPVPSDTYPPFIEGSADKLSAVCYETAHNIYGEVLPEIVENRLKKELESIISNGYAVVYYISHLLVKRSNEDGYLVGSRGSVGSSFVATMSGITEVNPLAPHYVCPSCKHSEFFLDGSVASGFNLDHKKCPVCDTLMVGDGHNIPFETFLGFDGDKVPDIDLNFSNEYQSKAHAFTKEVFGDDHVFRAGTIGTVADKTAFGYVTGYFEEMGITNATRAQKDYLASGCTGIKRTTGQHPGGIIVVPHDMEYSDFTPIQYPANDVTSEWKTTHFDFHDIHDNVLKFDLLGHIDPTAMRLLENISNINVRNIPMNDEKVLSLFSSSNALEADTRYYDEPTGALGLPEFGTKITRKVLEETSPKTFSDLVIISGLTHGTDVWAGNAQVLVQEGIALNEVIGCRDDIMTYLIEKGLVPKVAFNIMESVRKGKGLNDEWEGIMRTNNVPEWYIESCKKIKYMFPKAHACAYVIMAVRIAWFKVYYPQYFYVSFLTLRCESYEIETMTRGIEAIKQRLNDLSERQYARGDLALSNKEKKLIDTLEICLEMYARGYKIANIDLYRSKALEFVVDENDPKTIIPAFTTIDGLGVNVARAIEEARKDGEFLSKEDLISRTQISSKLVEKLDKLGCLNGLQDTNQISLF